MPPRFSVFSRGFTLVELLVTLTLMGILALAVVPLAQLSVKRQQERALREALHEIRHALDAWKEAVENGQISSDLTESGYPPTLEVLVEGVEDARTSEPRHLRFLRRIPPDPFAPADVSPVQTWGLRSYVSEADHPRAGADVFDVYSRADGVGLDGRPYREW